jgi:hypothetical protein
MSTAIKLRGDSTANWASNDPVILEREITVDTTLNRFKIGDGIKTWSQLNFTDKTLEDATVLKSAQPVYNVTIEIPLGVGIYYTDVEAALAVPEDIRKRGLIITFEKYPGIWVKMQFAGTDNNVIFEWGQIAHWVKEDNMFVDVTFQCSRTFSDISDARNSIPMKYRRNGIAFQYQLNDLSIVLERYIGTENYLTSSDWYSSTDFVPYYIDGSVSDTTKASLILSQFFVNGVFNASIYRQKLGGNYNFQDSATPRNLIPAEYRIKGLILTYFNENFQGILGSNRWVSERFIGDVLTGSDFYGDDSKWVFTENIDNVNNLADERILIDKGLTTPDISSTKFIIPDKMYFVKGRKLPFYRDSMFLDANKDRLRNWEVSMSTITSNGEGLCHTFGGSINLIGEDVGATIDLSVRKNGTVHPFYGKLVNANIVDATTKSGLSPKILMIGDSITNRYIPFNTKTILSSYGALPTMLGTLTNLGGEKGEGRENWTLSNILGWENMWGHPGDGQTITPSDATATTLYQNPFLKLADANDKLDYPDYCFRNSGAKKELSYSDDANKTGDFYIFSFSKYVTTNLQGNVPNVVTIALGTNDSNKGYSSFYPDVTTPTLLNARYWKALNFIITNIIESFPAIKIGVIPMYSRIDDYQWLDGSYATGLIESTIENIRTKNNANINVIGTWNNVSRYYGNYGSARVVLDEKIGVDTVDIASDTLHYSELGQAQIANSISTYILNVI